MAGSVSFPVHRSGIEIKSNDVALAKRRNEDEAGEEEEEVEEEEEEEEVSETQRTDWIDGRERKSGKVTSHVPEEDEHSSAD